MCVLQALNLSEPAVSCKFARNIPCDDNHPQKLLRFDWSKSPDDRALCALLASFGTRFVGWAVNLAHLPPVS